MKIGSSIFFIILFNYFAVEAQVKYEFPFQNPDLATGVRVHDLLDRMTLNEKVNQLFSGAPAVPRLGVPSYNWWNECLHGVARAGKATVFPQAIGLAASFNEKLVYTVADVISDEARAKHHYFLRNDARGIYMGLTFWTPNINIFRDPRWGRGQETYGEDPFLTSRIAVNFINGLQGKDPDHLKVVATAKHYAVHSGPELTRHVDNNFVNDRDLFETYLPAFKATVKEAHVQSVMCAYNRFRDKPCCGSDVLLSNILRNEFGFKGYVVSDCGAITDFYKKGNHHIVDTPEQALGWSLTAGTDLNCEENKAFVQNIDSAVNKGVVSEKDIDVSLTRLLTARFKLGMFDPENRQPYAGLPIESVGSKEHLQLALKSAQEAFVLLKNDGLLPLKNTSKVALIGPNANNISVLIGNYSGDPIAPVTPLAGLITKLGTRNVFYSAGSPIVPGIFTDIRSIGKANFYHSEKGKLKQGLSASYFQNTKFTGSPAITRVDTAINFKWEKSPIGKKVDESFSVRWSGVLIPQSTGKFFFSGNVKLWIDGIPAEEKITSLEKGKQYQIKVELVVEEFWWYNNHQQQFAKLGWVDTARDLNAEALQAASKADVVIYCGGISPTLEGEEAPLEIDGFAHGDRTNLELPAVQRSLLQQLHRIGKKIIYVNFSGSAVALNWEQENIPAIIQAFYPGEKTGDALTQILFGEVNPSGKLPVTFYKSIDDLPPFLNYTMEGRTYRYFKGDVLYPFGHGLSYTNFTYADINVNENAVPGDSVRVRVTLTNSGGADGAEVVQVYLQNNSAKVPVPIRTLVHFEKLFLAKGESRSIDFWIPAKRFSVIDDDYRRVIQSGSFMITIGGGQPVETKSSSNFLEAAIVLKGDAVRLSER